MTLYRHKDTAWQRLALAVWLFAGIMVPSAQAQDVAVTHCQGVCPQYQSNLAARRADVVIHHLYAAGLNGYTGLADWVAYQLTGEAVGVASLLPRQWQLDELIEFSPAWGSLELGNQGLTLAEISASNNLYAGMSAPTLAQEYSARLAPMTSFANTPYWPDLNKLSNMVIMPSSLRLGAWLQLEQALNRLARSKDTLHVVTGPLFLITEPLSTSVSAMQKPVAFFKVVVDRSYYAVFVFSAELQPHDSFCDQTAVLDQLERMSSLTLFPGRKLKQSNQLLAELGCNQLR
ncbi:MAG: DNA/RNA non-specific endonuclease [Gammaproteobacteria bacterium]|nr:DNA/RNA non-specific endonuclease [Gammaproteobacteria bacterium]